MAEAMALEKNDSKGDLQELRETKGFFEQAVFRFFKKCRMPEVTGEDQKRYTSHVLKKFP